MNAPAHAGPGARTLHGILFLIAATACFAALDATVKVLSATLSVLVAVWFRYLFHAVAMTVVILPTRGPGSLRTQHPGLQALRGTLLLITSTLSFISVIYMPLAEFTAIVMITPLMVTLLAAVFLKERVRALQWVLVVSGFCGALMVVRPGHLLHGWALLLPLALVLSYACFQILTSRLARTEAAMTMHFYTGWVGTLLMSLLVPWIWQPIHDAMTWAQLCLAGLMGTVGHFLLILAFGRAPTATLAPYLYAQIGFAMLAGWLVFNHVPGWLEFAGIALIVLCGITTAWLSAQKIPPEPA